jgi:hypothetical protein
MILFRTAALLAVIVAAACGGPVNTTPSANVPGSFIAPPSGVVNASPATITFTTAAVAPQAISASETGYSGTFTESYTCASIATLTPASASGPAASFMVTPVAAGSCTVTIGDAQHATATVSVTVTTSAFNVSAIGREIHPAQTLQTAVY